MADPDASEELVRGALSANTVIDISSSPALWGGFMRGTDAIVMTVGASDLERAMDEAHAHDLVQAHLIETLCSIGRGHIDFYFLPLRTSLAESQLSGALIALEEARQEGHVRFTGIAVQHPSAAMGILQFHDAFEAVLLEQPSSPVRLLAQSRRMAIVTRRTEEPPAGEASLIKVSTREEVDRAMGAQAAAR
jgi:aryl-alcohol dehydrogenase-like predicted oxidoreductase